METEIEITGVNTKGWFEKIKDWSYENWQTILVVLIVLIIGMSAYNYNQEGSDDTNANSIAVNDLTENEADENKESFVENLDQEIAIQEDKIAESDEKSVTTQEEDVIVEKDETVEIISSNDSTGVKYTITAVSGEGITHLARRALEQYIQDSGDGEDLAREHKIYIEDYLQNRVGDEAIKKGHQESFSENQIQEAITNARNLSAESMENLKKYIKN
ncbi:hypothetical protein KAJ41_03295 [Candidatus Parcubacteria bacterium]|nr:hypothetical protein [Candidatus Parcubacteria bacterium]